MSASDAAVGPPGRKRRGVSGIELARGYFRDVVAPLLASRWPALPYAAGRLGTGSDVLGLDDDRSRDHDWGLRLQVFVPAGLVDEVRDGLEADLPASYAGWPTRFSVTWDDSVAHRVEVTTPEAFVRGRLGLDVGADSDGDSGLSAEDWLCLTGQSVLEVTAGAVFVDPTGQLSELRRRLAWYPEQVWRYVVASDWRQLAEDLPLLGRAGQRGDHVGADLVAARVAGRVVHLAFTLDRSWAPYPKWTQALLMRLPVAGTLVPSLDEFLRVREWQQRQHALARLLDLLHRAQLNAGLPTPPGRVTEQFFDRPYLTIRPDVEDLLMRDVTDETLLRLPVGVGGVEQWTGEVALLAHAERRVAAARALLRAVGAPTAG